MRYCAWYQPISWGCERRHATIRRALCRQLRLLSNTHVSRSERSWSESSGVLGGVAQRSVPVSDPEIGMVEFILDALDGPDGITGVGKVDKCAVLFLEKIDEPYVAIVAKIAL